MACIRKPPITALEAQQTNDKINLLSEDPYYYVVKANDVIIAPDDERSVATDAQPER